MPTVTTTAAAMTVIHASSRKAKLEAFCTDYLQGYVAADATVDEMQTYSNCVDLFHPQSRKLLVSEGEMLAFQAAFLLVVAAMVFGMFKGDDIGESPVSRALFGAFFYSLSTILFLGIAGMLYAAFKALFLRG
jgi:hypothetical protein